jgi:hypothetical protein
MLDRFAFFAKFFKSKKLKRRQRLQKEIEIIVRAELRRQQSGQKAILNTLLQSLNQDQP